MRLKCHIKICGTFIFEQYYEKTYFFSYPFVFLNVRAIL